MNMIEKVAKAIAQFQGAKIVGPGRCEATREFGWQGGDGKHFDLYVEAHWKEYTSHAQAAIGAMKEPSIALSAIGATRFNDNAKIAQDCVTIGEAEELFNHMITAALEGK